MSSPHRFLFLITCLAALGVLLMAPAGVDAETKVPVKDRVANTKDYCVSLGGTFTVRGTADRAITECQYLEGDYTTCVHTATGSSCHSLEVDVRPVDEGDPRTVTPPDDATQDISTPLTGHRQSLA